MYRLKEAVVVYRNQNKTIVQLGTKKFTIVDEFSQFYKYITNGNLIDINTKKKTEKEYVNFLKKENLITESVKYVDDRFIKNEYFFEDINKHYKKSTYQDSIKKKHVIIIGLGGLGTIILQNLVAMGVMEFTLVDKDKVDFSNLNRQLYFTPKDINNSKVEVVQKYLFKYDSKINVNISKTFITDETIDEIFFGKEFDLIVNAADTPTNIVSIIAKRAISLDIPFITGGVGLRTGHFTNILSENKKIANLIKYQENNDRGKPMIGSISSTNMIIGSIMANEILNFWTNNKQCEQSRINYLNFENYHLECEEL
ncbi:ThiF family adenylyltransferase [Carnobacterium gallinarum]|uniref:ThiF family adenylyltransferase n=1 Tax=Carnobacterium gallinarum TaxID=2749 RepID=UPI000A03E47E|nr:ThiF family adenylyltransferase [Carnobacterium gallinarum]